MVMVWGTPYLLLIRIPLVSSYAWDKYQENWVDLDAPRHFYLHSEKSFKLLAKDTGYEVEKLVYDSTAFQFCGSEQYLKNISLMDPKSYGNDPENSIFTPDEIQEYAQKAMELNLRNKGDQACFFLRKS